MRSRDDDTAVAISRFLREGGATIPREVLEVSPEERGRIRPVGSVCERNRERRRFVVPDVLELPPINPYGEAMERAHRFGSEARVVQVVESVQRLLHAA